MSLEQVVTKYLDEQEQASLLHHDRDLVSSRERLVLSEQSGFQRYLCAASTGNPARALLLRLLVTVSLRLRAHETRHRTQLATRLAHMCVREAQDKCPRGRSCESLPSQASRQCLSPHAMDNQTGAIWLEGGFNLHRVSDSLVPTLAPPPSRLAHVGVPALCGSLVCVVRARARHGA